MNDLRIDFDPQYLAVLEVFKAQRDIRYYICGVYVEKAPQGGVYLVATDGHTMAVIYDKSGSIDGADNAIITVDPGMISAAKKGATKKSGNLNYRVVVRGTRAMVAVPDADGLELFIQPGKCLIEGKYPAWRKALPDFEKLKRGAFTGNSVNAIYLARFAKVAADKRYCGITLWQEAVNKPVIVQVERLPEALFVVLPLRSKDPVGFAAFLPPAQESVALEEAALA